ncbi:ABC transporter permease [Sporosarcina gallistercoris]|uniref:ABC transporter permease n=1 Tax=Sporosarcina gallistercoris TaxID=2762245 RepID=A0ABR8PM90_9BACL|nr:ABC transporter permease [Sporosarcina gallistercoris]MBD7909290.1 ABC transporter permease [Sporosarcina gallistercoris]
MGSSIRGSGRLSKFIVRRDVFRLLLWLVSISAVTFAVPPAFHELYPTQEQRNVMAETMRNPAMTAMVGPGNLESYTLGAMMSHQMLLLTAVTVALMNILLAVRFTRAEEEAGITEMIQSLSIGRRSPLVAAMTVLVGVNIALVIIIWVGLVILGMEGMESAGALLYGLTIGGTGLFFAGIAVVCAQLAESARGATSLAMVLLVISYMVRSAGDVAESLLSWFSPLGWVTFVQPFSGNNGWPIVLFVAGGILLGWLAGVLQGSRDLGAGFLRSKAGRTHASAYLTTPLGFVLRLQRTGIVIWAVGMLLLGVSYGSVLGDLETFFDGNELLENMLAGNTNQSVAEQFLPLLMLVMALIATIPGILAMHKLAGEEKVDRIDSVLGRSVSRIRLLGAYVSVAVMNGVVMNSIAALGLWLASINVMEEPLSAALIFAASAVQIPAILVMIGLSSLLIGIAPKWNSLVWLYLVYSFVTLYLGSLLQFPEWATRISPFGWVPEWPIESMDWVAEVSLVMIAVVFAVAGMVGYRKRDIQ